MKTLPGRSFSLVSVPSVAVSFAVHSIPVFISSFSVQVVVASRPKSSQFVLRGKYPRSLKQHTVLAINIHCVRLPKLETRPTRYLPLSAVFTYLEVLVVIIIWGSLWRNLLYLGRRCNMNTSLFLYFSRASVLKLCHYVYFIMVLNVYHNKFEEKCLNCLPAKILVSILILLKIYKYLGCLLYA